MARFVRSSLLSIDEVEDIAAAAAGGDNAALSRLGELNRRVGRMMNERMRKLEKAGETGDAYKRIQELNEGNTRFSTAKTGTAEDLFRNLESAMKAAGYKESTLGGISEVNQQTATSIFRHFGILGQNQEATRAQATRLSDFFKSDYWKTNKRSFTSDDLENIADVVKAGGEDYEALMDSIQSWDPEDPFGAVENWMEF